MNIVKVLIYAFRVILYETINEEGINSIKVVRISERLDILILKEQKKKMCY